MIRNIVFTLFCLIGISINHIETVLAQGVAQQPKPQESRLSTIDVGAASKTSRPSIEVDGFRIELVASVNTRNVERSEYFDIARIPAQSTTQHQSESTSRQQRGNGTTTTVGGSGSGFGGGHGGGMASAYTVPNFGMVFQITPLETSKNLIVEFGIRATAYGPNDELIESRDYGPSILQFPSIENQYPEHRFLYFYSKKPGVPDVQKVQGELRVIEGKTIEFDVEPPNRATTITKDKRKFVIHPVVANEKSIQFGIELPEPQSIRNARTPLERFEAGRANRGNVNIRLEDDLGNFYSKTGMWTANNAPQSNSWSSSTSTRGQGRSTISSAIGGTVGNMEQQLQQVEFAPLPESRSVKRIHIRFTERAGEVKIIPFEFDCSSR
jgi:hypothetical protein